MTTFYTQYLGTWRKLRCHLLIFAVLRGFRGITAGHVSDHLLQPFMWLHLQTSRLSVAGYVLYLHIPDKLNSSPDMRHGLSIQLEQFCFVARQRGCTFIQFHCKGLPCTYSRNFGIFILLIMSRLKNCEHYYHKNLFKFVHIQ